MHLPRTTAFVLQWKTKIATIELVWIKATLRTGNKGIPLTWIKHIILILLVYLNVILDLYMARVLFQLSNRNLRILNLGLACHKWLSNTKLLGAPVIKILISNLAEFLMNFLSYFEVEVWRCILSGCLVDWVMVPKFKVIVVLILNLSLIELGLAGIALSWLLARSVHQPLHCLGLDILEQFAFTDIVDVQSILGCAIKPICNNCVIRSW